MSGNSSLWFYAGLSEAVYRRSYRKDASDQPLFIKGDYLEDPNQSLFTDWSLLYFPGSKASFLQTPSAGASPIHDSSLNGLGSSYVYNTSFTFDGSYVYDLANGFCAMVAQNHGQYVVTFRGTDDGAASAGIFSQAIQYYLAGRYTNLPATNGQVDYNDVVQDLVMGSGLGLANSQAQDAIDLTLEVIQLAGITGT